MSKPLAKQLAETIDSLVRQFGDLPQHVDFSTDYRTRLPSRKVEIVAKHLDQVGEVFLADALREAYKRLHEAVFAKPVDPDSLTLTDAEEQRLAAMNDEDRRLAMENLRRLGSEEELQRDLQRTADRMVELLEEVKGKVAGRTNGTGGEDDGGGELAPPRTPAYQSKCVKLFGPGEQPEVCGKPKPTLTAARYDGVQTLIEAGDTGLTKDELDRKSGHIEARKTLKRLADSDRDWKCVLLFPGTTGKRYRIR